MWHDVRGYHGVGELNESGEDLLSFCALNELTIMNTMFEKASIFKHTWQHLGQSIGTVLITSSCVELTDPCVMT